MSRSGKDSRPLLGLLFFLVLALSGCASRGPAGEPPRPAPPVATLQHDLDSIFGAPEFTRSIWGVVVQSLDTGDTLFARNPTTLLMPASNMKILTLAASIDRLGWDHTFETRLVTTAPIRGGILLGDLIVVGGGDPSLGSRVGDEGRVLASWADQLWAAGIRTIDGRLIGDDRLFDDDGVGAGWSWDDLALGYAAPIGALTYDENVVELVVRPGPAAGQPAELTLRPSSGGLVVMNGTITEAEGDLSLALRRAPGSAKLEARGFIPLSLEEFVRTVSVVNPTDFFLGALREALTARGIAVAGPDLDIDVLSPRPDVSTARLLVSHRSAPLAELAMPLMKVSRNLYGDTLLKTLGADRERPGTARAGREAMREVLEDWNIAADSIIISDGSGLSRYNYVTPNALVAVLGRFADDVRFDATLPVAGQDGTLAGRLQGTRADDNARAKGGSMSNVRALSGYLRTRDSERLVFSIISNNFSVEGGTVDLAMDRALVRLADFSRRSR